MSLRDEVEGEEALGQTEGLPVCTNAAEARPASGGWEARGAARGACTPEPSRFCGWRGAGDGKPFLAQWFIEFRCCSWSSCRRITCGSIVDVPGGLLRTESPGGRFLLRLMAGPLRAYSSISAISFLWLSGHCKSRHCFLRRWTRSLGGCC